MATPKLEVLLLPILVAPNISKPSVYWVNVRKTGGTSGTNQYRVKGQAVGKTPKSPPPGMAVWPDPNISLVGHPDRFWHQMLEHPDPTMRIEMGYSSYCPVPVRRQLLVDSNWQVRQAAVTGTNDPDLIDLAAQDRSKAVRTCALVHSHCSLSTLWTAFRGNNENDDLALTKNPRTPPDMLHMLVSRAGPQLAKTLIGNPRTPKADWLQLVQQDPEVMDLALQYSVCPSEVVGLAAAGTNPGHLRRAAGHRHCPPAYLHQLADSPDSSLRFWVAGNPATPPETLEMLAQDPIATTRMAVVRHLNTTTSALRHIWQRDAHSTQIVYQMAAHPNCPIEVLQQLAGDPNGSIRCLVAGHLSTTADGLMRLADDSNVQVRRNLAGNPHTPAEALIALLTKSNDHQVRRDALSHPNTPDHIRAIGALGH